ncbi:MAG: hypothetical protein J6C54_03695 [Lachnospiraceae bacterium]|nr:hypothetical protein [Lachnospiraceae bacterium]
MHKQQYEDYKYVMQDTYQLYLGAKYSFEELIDNEEVPFKFRLIVERYIYQDVDPQTTLESQLYYMTSKDLQYRIYRQIKMKVKVNVIEEKKSLTGKCKKVYTTRILPIEELVKMTSAEKEEKGMVIQELMCSKLALMTF